MSFTRMVVIHMAIKSSIIKNFTLMSDIFMRNVFKQRECLECSAGHYGKTGSESN